NRLARETSPYLLQHAHNPVDWYPWGSEAFERAKKENKPIFLSIGYSSCHWCHVMEQEVFEYDDVAEFMNANFICIKVDREERPDLDAVYMEAVQMLTGRGGWPMSVFLTPDLKPFYGGTYFPKKQFMELTRRVDEAFRERRSELEDQANHLTEQLAGQMAGQNTAQVKGQAAGTVNAQIIASAVESVSQRYDKTNGGFQQDQKFPTPVKWRFLLHEYRRSGDRQLGQMIVKTCEAMAQGGLYDHVGGGFHRYTVDADWTVPHFEKMLYDNAQLLELLTAVWLETRDPLYARRIEETVGWLLREMTEPGGGFASSLDADSEGEEGLFYVWSKAEVDALLGSDAGLFSDHYDVSKAGNWEGHVILNRLTSMELGDDETEATLARCRAVLFEARAPRIRPGKDDKLLADWNGLMIAALAMAGQALDRTDWVAAAARAYAFVRENMVVDGRLRHSWRAGRADHPATLDDHANLARAALLLQEATGDDSYLEQAEGWVGQINDHYTDANAGGFFFAADDTPGLIVRNKTAGDNPTPSGNGTAAEVLARLWLLTGKDEYRAGAEAVITAFSGEVARNFFPLSTLLSAAEFLFDPVQIVMIGDRNAEDAKLLAGVTFSAAPPNRVFQCFQPDRDIPEGHPAHGKTQKDTKATIYVCRGQSCSLPIADPAELTEAFSRG
ncbi:MAG: thioredoxin domain-containing protein, partial [Alphaproteobacteria bacterium]|nr:thioredoxin domain-containing protein [Alphaproteobacteria bacterium]